MAMKLIDAEQLDSDLTNLADSIRAKTGTEGTMYFPDGFITEVDNIESAYDTLAEIEHTLSNGNYDYSNWFEGMIQISEVPMKLLQHINQGVLFQSTFRNCVSLTEIPVFDTSSGSNFSSFCYGCENLWSVGGINITHAQDASDVSNMFYGCFSLENLTFNGFIKTTGLDLSYCSNLTHDSLMSAINALYDWASKGSTKTYKLTLNTISLETLTDAEKAIATQKGWTLVGRDILW